VVLITFLIVTIYWKTPYAPLAPGYRSPTDVLPSYESAAGIPFCLPQSVDNYELHGSFAGFRDEDGKLRKTHEKTAASDSVPAEGIKAYMRAHISQKQRGFDPVADEEYLGVKLHGSIDLEGYTADLMQVYEEFLALPHMKTPSFLPLLKSRLSLSPPIAALPPRPRVITTTDAHRNLVPWEFSRWQELLPDWEIRIMEDSDMEGWMENTFGGTLAEEIWKALPRIVLKTDILRYATHAEEQAPANARRSGG
jgi:hypothetical protein